MMALVAAGLLTLRANPAIPATDPLSFAGRNLTLTSNLLTGVCQTPAAHEYFVAFDPSKTNVVRNRYCVLSPYSELRAVSPMVVDSGQARQIYSVAITDRHVESAAHVGVSSGWVVVFFDSGNGAVFRSVVAVTNMGFDVSISLLDADLPPSIGHMKALPPVHLSVLIRPSIHGTPPSKNNTVPVFNINQFGNVNVQQYYSDLAIDAFFSMDCNPRWFPEWAYTVTSGDSSSPVFSLTAQGVVYWGSWFTSTSFTVTGSGLSQRINDAIATMDAVNSVPGNYALDAMNTNGFVLYP